MTLSRIRLFLAVLALLSSFGTDARADAAFDAAIDAQTKLGAAQKVLNEKVAALDSASSVLVTKAKVKTSDEGKSLDGWCKTQTTPLCGKLTASDATETSREAALQKDVKKNTYPLSEWCDKGGDSTICKPFVDAEAAVKSAKDDVASATEDLDKAKAEYAKSVQSTTGLGARLAGARKARCLTAYCWGGPTGTKFAFEPILDLPIGLTWALGNGALARHINASGLDVRLNAGIRIWFANDIVSVGVVLFQPALTSPSSIHFEGISQDLGSDAIRRPYPSLALGFAGDIFLLTVSYDQLRNTTSSGSFDKNYLPDEVLSRSFTFGLYLAPFTTARNGIGASQ